MGWKRWPEREVVGMNFAIVDDEAESVSVLRSYLERCCQEKNIAVSIFVFQDGLDFITNYVPKYDAVFLDIRMRRSNGLEIAEKMRELDGEVSLVFVTNIHSMAVEGYRYDAINFLTKPISYISVKNTLEKLLRRQRLREGDSLYLLSEMGMKKIPIRQIVYIEVYVHTITIHTVDEVIERRGSLKKYEELLKSEYFIYIHRSYMINLRYLTEIRQNYAYVGQEKLQIAGTRKKAVMEALARYLDGGNE